MTTNIYYNPKNSLTLYEIEKHLDFLMKLYTLNKLPKVLMLSGKKGIGKSTLVNHFLNFVYDKDEYDIKKKKINKESSFNKKYLNNSFFNIIYLSGDDFKNVKVEDIRDLKKQLLKTTILNKERFIILDDVELFNLNSLNALLKIIEEPTENNYFVLINNKTRNLIDTIYSRSLEVKISLTNMMREKIIESLINNFSLKVSIDYQNIKISPGNFLIFNEIMNDNNLNINDDYLASFKKILVLYKKNKDINLINLALLFTDNYFSKLKENSTSNIDLIFNNKSYVIDNINKFVNFNLNQNSLISAINSKLTNE